MNPAITARFVVTSNPVFAVTKLSCANIDVDLIAEGTELLFLKGRIAFLAKPFKTVVVVNHDFAP
jgi:hypothetical protein